VVFTLQANGEREMLIVLEREPFRCSTSKESHTTIGIREFEDVNCGVSAMQEIDRRFKKKCFKLLLPRNTASFTIRFTNRKSTPPLEMAFQVNGRWRIFLTGSLVKMNNSP